ncbi:protein spinster homolog 1-like [Ranitomeya variabilis]|uniref:protein spinster homolog 1-like n=1 Tax=Ranitomeya variabilis TaxID=490064 RepID=UPI004055F873
MASVQSCTHTTIQMFDAEEEEKAMLERQNIDDRSVISHVRSIIIVLILSYINLVIYMDFFTENGVMPNLQSDFHLESSGLGLKNIVSICSQVLAHQVFGYLGDRFNRKYIMCAGMSFWAIMNLCITFIPNEYFQLFLEMRRLIGIAKVCCSTMAPTIIADLFVGRQRGCMLSIYYFTEPLGCGLGYIIASTVTRAAGGDWRWAFRVTPGLGLIAVLLFISFVKEPQREIFDRNSNKLPSCKTWMMDMKHLIKNKSFMLSTFGIANVKFVTGAITSWAPSFLMLTGVVTKQKEPCQPDVCDHHDRYKFIKP